MLVAIFYTENTRYYKKLYSQSYTSPELYVVWTHNLVNTTLITTTLITTYISEIFYFSSQRLGRSMAHAASKYYCGFFSGLELQRRETDH
jgi:hypothetical protein